MLALPAPSAERDLANYLALREARFENPHLRYYIAPRPARDAWWTFQIHDGAKNTKLWAVSTLWESRRVSGRCKMTVAMVLAGTKRAAASVARQAALAQDGDLAGYKVRAFAAINANEAASS